MFSVAEADRARIRGAAELLEAAAVRISGGRWCRGRTAENEFGESVGSFSPTAVKWCAGGALTIEAGRFEVGMRYPVFEEACAAFRKSTGRYVPFLNDDAEGVDEVVAALLGAAGDLRGRADGQPEDNG